ncbi:hypothetical protein V500_02094 [Pseudogymnoascus sp. VKM F-4518 (FW-2643)]|nr:hypothetical protein V500_02094 [Pseudogymnoascus sp. VKM F-4518 (FW-2643)]
MKRQRPIGDGDEDEDSFRDHRGFSVTKRGHTGSGDGDSQLWGGGPPSSSGTWRSSKIADNPAGRRNDQHQQFRRPSPPNHQNYRASEPRYGSMMQNSPQKAGPRPSMGHQELFQLRSPMLAGPTISYAYVQPPSTINPAKQRRQNGAAIIAPGPLPFSPKMDPYLAFSPPRFRFSG